MYLPTRSQLVETGQVIFEDNIRPSENKVSMNIG